MTTANYRRQNDVTGIPVAYSARYVAPFFFGAEKQKTRVNYAQEAGKREK